MSNFNKNFTPHFYFIYLQRIINSRVQIAKQRFFSNIDKIRQTFATQLVFLHYFSIEQRIDQTTMRIFIRILLFSSLFFASCSKQENVLLLKQLDDIKAMGDTLPQVAMQRLDSIKPLFDNETEYMSNKLALLEIRLQDKAYITHTTDKQIKNICCFFEENGTDIEKQEAYYYMGSVYRDLNDYPNAITYFLKSTEIAENSKNTNKRILQNAYSQLSYLYGRLLDYTKALDIALKQLDIAEKNGTVNERTYMNVASYNMAKKDTANAIKYYNYAIKNINNKVIDRKKTT